MIGSALTLKEILSFTVRRVTTNDTKNFRRVKSKVGRSGKIFRPNFRLCVTTHGLSFVLRASWRGVVDTPLHLSKELRGAPPCPMTAAKSLSIREAAARAAATYVWDESHKKGVEAGWAAGWAAAMAEVSAGLSQDTSARENAVSLEQDEDGSSSSEGQLELDSTWAALFVEGAARRAAERRADDAGSTKRPRVALDLGGTVEAARTERAKRMYGEDATRIMETEAELAASFDALLAKSKASLWPVLSIREGEAPRETG